MQHGSQADPTRHIIDRVAEGRKCHLQAVSCEHSTHRSQSGDLDVTIVVPEQDLDHTDVGLLLQQVSGEGVAQNCTGLLAYWAEDSSSRASTTC